MEQRGKLQFIGTGASSGVPMIGCQCSICRSKNPKNHRLRSSVHIGIEGKQFIIDASPDFREQALRFTLPFPDALFLTHTHYDHVGGLEELRAYNIKANKPIRCYLSESSFENIKKLYYYHFTPKSEEKSFSACIDFHVLESTSGQFDVDGIQVEYFSYAQGKMPVTGFRIGRLAYVTDIKQHTASLLSHLRDLDVLILSAGWRTPSRMQLTIDEALEFQRKIGANKTYFIHLSHDIEYRKVNGSLPKGVALAYDGLEIDFA